MLDQNLLHRCLSVQVKFADASIEKLRIDLMKRDNNGGACAFQNLVIILVYHRISNLLKNLLVESGLVAQNNRELLQKHLKNAIESQQVVHPCLFIFLFELQLVVSFNLLEKLLRDHQRANACVLREENNGLVVRQLDADILAAVMCHNRSQERADH